MTSFLNCPKHDVEYEYSEMSQHPGKQMRVCPKCREEERAALSATFKVRASQAAGLDRIRAEARNAGLESAGAWHDQRAKDTPDAFEMEFHQVSAAAIRALKTEVGA